MGTPIEELSEPDLHSPPTDPAKKPLQDREQPVATGISKGPPRRSEDDDNDDAFSARRRPKTDLLLTATDATTRSTAADERPPSPTSRAREAANRLGDHLAVLQAERKVSSTVSDRRSEHLRRRSRDPDDFGLDAASSSGGGESRAYPGQADTGCGRAFKRIRDSAWLVRYFMYIMPVFLLLLVPVLLGLLVFEEATVGDVRLLWFAIWLEIVWLSLWAARVSLYLARELG